MRPFENTVGKGGKGENASHQHFLLFPQCFLPFPYRNFNFSVTSILSSANAFNLDQSEILSFVKELTLYHKIPTFNEPGNETF